MSWIAWLIVIIPTAFVMFLGMYSRKYVHSVADFLSAGRCARRYVLSMGDVANALAVTGLVAYVEVHYKTGFAIAFWNSLIAPLTIAMGLYGYCTYRFRETRAMSLGQFLEMRYNRKFRIFACALRSISEMLANMIMPAVAARFFIYFLDLPHYITVCGITIPTFLASRSEQSLLSAGRPRHHYGPESSELRETRARDQDQHQRTHRHGTGTERKPR